MDLVNSRPAITFIRFDLYTNTHIHHQHYNMIRATSHKILLASRSAGTSRAMIAASCRIRTSIYTSSVHSRRLACFSSSSRSLLSYSNILLNDSSSNITKDEQVPLNPVVQELVFSTVYGLLDRAPPAADEDQTSALTLDTHLINDLKMDVFKMYQVMDKVERDLSSQWQVDIAIEEADKVRTLRDIVQLISSKIRKH
ncbi:hypothetical protein BGZ83_011267 [Gryganskiella cystojenkinii]|nr:hypothetical protein BGZ83_011267 [Gryganskiella cystojenkinii]